MPAPPLSTSAPAPPWSRSLPPLPLIVSLPPRPMRTLSRELPVIVSLNAEPTTFSKSLPMTSPVA
ncbi:hypothetical protein CU103_14365 [Phyllobacterium sophorae]|uniref:Uncharacterized protein n=1 Tax=Phyllobacterium sophorae TaxID=1520277 RepID=A0A2P7BAJ9_9HYPH|nr:hypothetical protein CU103_14365 [Phyllobacterium sophorae]